MSPTPQTQTQKSQGRNVARTPGKPANSFPKDLSRKTANILSTESTLPNVLEISGPALGALRLKKESADILRDRGRITELQHSLVLAGIIKVLGDELELSEPPISQKDLPDPDLVSFVHAWWDAYGDDKVYAGQLEKLCKDLDLLGREIGFKTQRSRQCKLAVFLRHQTEKTIDGCRIGITQKIHQKQSQYFLEVVS